jgi:hypothetical protein
LIEKLGIIDDNFLRNTNEFLLIVHLEKDMSRRVVGINKLVAITI